MKKENPERHESKRQNARDKTKVEKNILKEKAESLLR